jgi:ATP-dependent DNA helicase RecG
VRKFKVTVPAPSKLMRSEQQVKSIYDYDAQWVEGATCSDLDLKSIKKLVVPIAPGTTVEQWLTQLDLVVVTGAGWRISRAALLLFAKEIQRWHPRSHVRVIKVDGVEMFSGSEYNVVSDEFVQANVYELPLKAWALLQPHLLRPTADYSGEEWMYPEVVCKELLMNAIVHRDYSVNNSIEIYIFDDRIEINSPGVLPTEFNLEVSDGLIPVFQPRNRKIIATLQASGVLQGVGKGLSLIQTTMKAHEFIMPVFHRKSNTFTVVLYNKCEFNVAQQLFLKQFKHLSLTNLEKKVLVAGMHDKELSLSDINRVLNTDDRDIYQPVIDALRDAGVLIQFRTKMEARTIAFKQQQDKLQIPRFKVALPARNN